MDFSIFASVISIIFNLMQMNSGIMTDTLLVLTKQKDTNTTTNIVRKS